MSKNHPDDNIYSILGKLEALQPTPKEQHDAQVQQIRESVEAQGSIIKGLRSISPIESRLAQQFAEGRVDMPSSSVKSVYYPDKAQSPIKKSRFAYDAQGEENFKKYPDQTSRPAGMNPDPASRRDMDEVALENKADELADDDYDHDGKIETGKNEYLGSKIAAAKKAGKLKEGTCPSCHKDPCECEEEKCNECGMYESKCSCDHDVKEGYTVTKGPDRYGRSYYNDPDFTGDEPAKAKNPTGQRGRPKKADNEKSAASLPQFGKKFNDPFGRVPGEAPKGKKGTVHKMSGESLESSISKVARRLSEGVNLAELLKQKHQTVEEMLAELSADMKMFKDTGHCSELLRDCMEIKAAHGKIIADEAANPNNPFYKKQNDYDLPPGMRGHGTPDYKLPDVKAHDNIERDSYRDRAGLDPMQNELNELARLAGLTVADEGNEFSGNRDTAIKNHQDTFVVGGHEYPVKEANAPVDEPVEEPVNGPKPEYKTMRQSTLNPGEDDNGEKAMHGDKPTFKNGDNPLTRPTLEARLAAEYESIKKVTK